MNKKPLARMMRRPPAQTEPLHVWPGQITNLPSPFIVPPKLHPNVGTIGRGLRDELLEEYTAHELIWGRPTQYDHSLLDKAVSERMMREIGVDVQAAVGRGMTTAEQIERNELEIEFSLTHVQRMAEQMRRLKEEQTCDVPPELRQRFIDAGLSEDTVDRMIIYPNRCCIRGNVVEIIYKLRDADGNPPKEPSVPQWVHVNGVP